MSSFYDVKVPYTNGNDRQKCVYWQDNATSMLTIHHCKDRAKTHWLMIRVMCPSGVICLLAHWNTQELYVYLRIEIHKSYMSTCALKYTSIICLLAHWNTQALYVYLRIEIHKSYMSTCALKYTSVMKIWHSCFPIFS